MRGVIEHEQDLIAKELKYNFVCKINFCSNKAIPKKFCTETKSSERRGAGRPKKHEEAFDYVTNLVKNSVKDQFTVDELIEVMQSQLPEGEEAYTQKHMKLRLKEHFDKTWLCPGFNKGKICRNYSS